MKKRMSEMTLELVEMFAENTAVQTDAAFEASEALKRWEEGTWALDPE